jgi:hypothetical protein
MSRGPGRIQRAIRRLFDEQPDQVFLTDDLVRYCFPDAEPVLDREYQQRVRARLHGTGNYINDEDADKVWPPVKTTARKHQVSVRRAAALVIASDPDWRKVEILSSHGTPVVFMNYANVRSYTLGNLICREYLSEKHARLRSPDTFEPGSGMSRDALLALAAAYPEILIPPVGDEFWERQVQKHRMRRDAPMPRQASAAELAEMEAVITDRLNPVSAAKLPDAPHGNAYLAAIAERVRALASLNDLDAVRTAAESIGGELDVMISAFASEPNFRTLRILRPRKPQNLYRRYARPP